MNRSWRGEVLRRSSWSGNSENSSTWTFRSHVMVVGCPENSIPTPFPEFLYIYTFVGTVWESGPDFIPELIYVKNFTYLDLRWEIFTYIFREILDENQKISSKSCFLWRIFCAKRSLLSEPLNQNYGNLSVPRRLRRNANFGSNVLRIWGWRHVRG